MKSLPSFGLVVIFTTSALVLNSMPAQAGFFTNCREIKGGFSMNKRMVCDGDFGKRVVVECDSLGMSCIKVCTLGGISDGC